MAGIRQSEAWPAGLSPSVSGPTILSEPWAQAHWAAVRPIPPCAPARRTLHPWVLGLSTAPKLLPSSGLGSCHPVTGIGLSPQVDPLTSCHAEWLPQAPRRWPHLSPRPCSPSAMNGMTKCEGATGQAPPMQHPSLHCTPGHHRPARPLWARCLLVSDARFLASSRSSPGLQELHAAHPDSGDG